MKKTLSSFIYILCCSLLLNACSGLTLNEGSTRMMMSKPTKGDFQNGAIFFQQPSDLSGALIEINDYVSVRLTSAFICDFRESAVLSDITASSNSGSELCSGGDSGKGEASSSTRPITRGEIIMIANIGEYKDSKNFSFDPQTVRDRGKVLYYNEDIRESGQLINAINLPIYGPQKYEGYPFYFDITLMELDNQENKEIKAMLGTLADLGQLATTNPLISSVVKPLSEALVHANTDDVEMRYQVGFDVKGASNSTIERLRLSENYYAIVRKESRSQIQNPNQICVDNSTGLILKKTENTTDCKLKVNSDGSNNVYRDSTWLLLRISKEAPDSPQVNHLLALEGVKEFLDRNKLWDTQSQTEALQSFQSITKAVTHKKQVNELSKFKGKPSYLTMLTTKLEPLGAVANGAVSEDQIQKEANNKIVLNELAKSVSNMPCYPQFGESNYDTQIGALKAITIDKVSIEDGGKIKLTGVDGCN